MVECEWQIYLIQNHQILVLIDTWWNVNLEEHSCSLHAVWVLIDTWWNVNILTPQSFGEEQLVLIDTWWNVNDYDDIVFGINCEF